MSTSIRKCDKCGYTTLNSTICHQCGNKLGFFADYMHADDLAEKMAEVQAPRNCLNCDDGDCVMAGAPGKACGSFVRATAVSANKSAQETIQAPSPTPTGIEALVCADIADRQALGIAKYGKTVAENPLSLEQWLQHAYEECLDQAVYLKRAIAQLHAIDNLEGGKANGS